MTFGDCHRQSTQVLQKAGCDSPAFDARCLLESCGGMPRGYLPLWRDREMPEASRRAVAGAVRQRAEGRPLQYILGEWDFLGLTLEVGEGVLIPRPDTELLCETAAAYLQKRYNGAPVRVLDLCAGSGCVGLGTASLYPEARVTAVELSEAAFSYLTRNCCRYPSCRVTPARGDVLADAAAFGAGWQAILSNPPYIPSQEIPALSREVRREPAMALDGGDGLVFYRAIAEKWIPLLDEGGLCAAEVGAGQAEPVAALWAAAGLRETEIYTDLAGIGRVVAGIGGKRTYIL